MSGYLTPQWNLPQGVSAAITTASAPGNLATHVGDAPSIVLRHRQQLCRDLQLPSAPRWLQQVHSNTCISFAENYPSQSADAIYSDADNAVCAVLTADCLPILLCSSDGREIAAVHAGWRGLVNGVLASTLARFRVKPSAIQAYIGPAIARDAFEVGLDVYQQFLPTGWVDDATFRPHITDKWHADLPLLATRALAHLGIQEVVQSRFDTFSDSRFYSYRRQPKCGRIATLIWKN